MIRANIFHLNSGRKFVTYTNPREQVPKDKNKFTWTRILSYSYQHYGNPMVSENWPPL